MSDVKDHSDIFLKSEFAKADIVGDGIKRVILGYDPKFLCAQVWFEKGAVGYVHQHPHSQMTYIISGSFEVKVGDARKVMKAGECFYAPPNIDHGSVCLEAGSLLDVFSPVRKDFLNPLEGV